MGQGLSQHIVFKFLIFIFVNLFSVGATLACIQGLFLMGLIRSICDAGD